MNFDQACKILELQPPIDEDSLKKRFKKLAAEYHPDRNKSPEAETKFKEISEAFEFLKENPVPIQSNVDINMNRDIFDIINKMNINFPGFGFGGFSGFQGFGSENSEFLRVESIGKEDIYIDLDLTFKESVMGCNKTIEYHHVGQCKDCHGTGRIVKSDCNRCGGTGEVVQRHGSLIVKTHCGCHAKRTVTTCKSCNHGSINDNVTTKIRIQPGVRDGQTLRIRDRGNFNKLSENKYRLGDLFIKLHIEKKDNIDIINENLHSIIRISLLEALEGAEKEVESINGSVMLKIPPGTKNGDKKSFAGLGLGGVGSHIFEILVEYPNDINKLIEVLKNG